MKFKEMVSPNACHMSHNQWVRMGRPSKVMGYKVKVKKDCPDYKIYFLNEDYLTNNQGERV